MKNNRNIVIRTARTTDIENLKNFFIKAYAEQTIFQNDKFLLYYFDSRNDKLPPLSYSLIGINSDNEIVSHYGGLHYKLKLNKTIISVIWGVNAYTLPEWRGCGINSKIVNYIHENNEANAVIGMPFDAPFFYKKLGYNIFNKETLKRFVYGLDSRIFDIVNLIGSDLEKAEELLKVKKISSSHLNSENIIELTKYNFENFNFDLDVDIVATTFRDVNFLSWRLFNNPYINYKVYGYLKTNKIVSYIAIREEILEPTNYKVSRIIDLFGDKVGVINLLNHTINTSRANGSIYIDFSVYGNLYEKELLSAGFEKLENEEVTLLPMVSSPIEKRPNHEFLVVQSKLHNDEIQNLSSEQVYFTRIDGDRDRIARITQLKLYHEK
ncbi:MAG: GNAT family N-acetyltransferase [Flavobacteriales bacterium]|nr:GNAT family N-acetyltransferase [Flavobacteriales bacterium]